jgi:branched-chain amino acid transport system permease protein
MLLVSGILQGIVTGMVLAFVTAGMTLIYRVSGIANFAHGSLLALALYLTLDLSRRFAIDPLYLSIPLVPIMWFVGCALYWGLIRLVRNSHHLLIVQLLLGLSFVIESLLLMRYGADLHSISNGLSSRYATIAGTGFALNALFAFTVAAVGLLALAEAVQRTDWGRKLRAVASDELAARLAGISVERIEGLVWAAAVAILGLIAPAMASITTLTPDMGLHYTVLALVIMIVGGMGSLVGTIWAGVLVGIAQSVGLLYLPGSYGALLPYALLVGVLIVYPGGVASLLRRAA